MIATWLMAVPLVVVGVLTEQGVQICEKGQERWVNPYFEVGFQRVAFEPAPPAELVGKVVVVRGEKSEPPRQAPLPPSDLSCPVMQMRSDWIPSKGGFRIRRSGSPAERHVTAKSVEPFKGLTAKAEPDGVKVRLENTLGVPLTGVSLRMHYEGCYGKPGSDERTHLVGELAPGAVAEATFPRVVTREMARGNEHVPSTLQVIADGVVMDLDVRVRTLGAAVECKSP